MISFIIIGRNEGWKLTKCLKSVYKTIVVNALTDCEVIYVDSKSTDDSIERVKCFKETKIFQLTGKINAAIARNIGVKESRGDVLFFIDGDMEINPEFLLLVYSEESGLKYPFVSGQLKNFNYNEQGKFLNNTWQYKQVLSGDRYFTTTGGIFLIERKLWNQEEGMDVRFKRGQDLEFALRLAKNGTKILRKKEIVANHSTISYTHHSRMWKTVFSGDISFSNSFLLKKHVFNPYVYPIIVTNYYTAVSLFVFFSIAGLVGNYYLIGGYFAVILIKIIKVKSKKILRNFELFVFFILRDLSFLFYLFFPLPNLDESKIKYKKIFL
ncbi:MAG: glycosyltransferase [Bacteroidales bacterium]|nr:glycosyltransferase [Bacteroidales bacterium]